jgi:hypothetical protein
MNEAVAEELMKGLYFELDNINVSVKPKTIQMSPELHIAIGGPYEIRDIPIIINDLSKKHWMFR